MHTIFWLNTLILLMKKVHFSATILYKQLQFVYTETHIFLIIIIITVNVIPATSIKRNAAPSEPPSIRVLSNLSVPIYVTVHGKTNHIAVGLDLRYEPNKSPVVIIIHFHFLAWIDRGIIPLHKHLLRSF